jgi:adenylate kinase
MNLVLFGPPGAGKGTQGTMLAENRGLLKISTGDLLRDAARAGTPLGLKAKEYMDAGELVPDSVILGLVREVIEAAPDAKGFIMDGFPRTLPQAEGVDRLLAEIGKPIDALILLDVDDDQLIKRLSGRRTCPNCGTVYNIYFEMPANDQRCDRCGSGLIQRADDSQQTVLRRLEVYREQTAPLIAYYEGRNVPVKRIAGDRTIDDVQCDILRIVDR